MEYKEVFERIKTFCNSDNGYPYNQYMQSSTPRNEDLEIIEKVLEDYSNIKNKIENGTLIELPCKVGDIIYEVTQYKTIVPFQCYSLDNLLRWTEDGLFGNDLFLTKEQAEEKIKELKSKE